MKWFDSPSEVPVSRAILQDELEQHWPHKQFSVHIHRPGRRSPFQYQVGWTDGPTNEEVFGVVNERFSSAPFFTIDLERTTAHECGVIKKELHE